MYWQTKKQIKSRFKDQNATYWVKFSGTISLLTLSLSMTSALNVLSTPLSSSRCFTSGSRPCLLLNSNITKTKNRYQRIQTWFSRQLHTGRERLITGRNEVVAKVIFLHLSVIHSVHREEGVCPSACWDTTPPDQADTPPGPGRHAPPRDQADTPQTRQTPPWTRQTPPGPGRHPPGPGRTPLPPRSRLQHTVYEWPVRILLECILVRNHSSARFCFKLSRNLN